MIYHLCELMVSRFSQLVVFYITSESVVSAYYILVVLSEAICHDARVQYITY
jgi:hypothetical protein